MVRHLYIATHVQRVYPISYNYSIFNMIGSRDLQGFILILISDYKISDFKKISDRVYRIATTKQSKGKTFTDFAVFAQSRKFSVEYFIRLGVYYYKKLLPRKFSRRMSGHF